MSIVVQSNGKILVGGNFSTYNGVAAPCIVRLNADGTRDATFNQTGTGLGSGLVYAITLQSDGKIVAVGNISSYNGTAYPGAIRLNADGTLDNTFVLTGTGFTDPNWNGRPRDVIVQSDGKILVAGAFIYYNGDSSAGYLVRLNADGSRDGTFTSAVSIMSYGGIYDIALQSDGKILAGGNFSSPTKYLVRLNTNGTRDTSFASTGNGLNSIVNSLAIQPDGKVIAMGSFTNYNWIATNYLARFNTDGALDATFAQGDSGLNGDVFKLVLQPDGKILEV